MSNIELNKEPTEVLEYLKTKDKKLSFNYKEIRHEAHHKAFTVAKVTKLDLLSDIQDELIKSFKSGEGFLSFKDNLVPILKKKGWWGETEVVDPKSGKKKNIYVGSNRLKTIYETNARVAYAQARYKSQMESDGEYFRYVSVLDGNTRATHKLMHGVILPKSHKFWEKNYPPNDWRCRCKVQSLTKEEMSAYGFKISKSPPSSHIASEDFSYNLLNDEPLSSAFSKKLDSLIKNCPQKNAKNRECQDKLYEVAKEESILNVKVFQKWFKYPNESIEIANLTPKIRKVLNVKTKKALISKDTIEKNKYHHPDIEWYEYLLINLLAQKSKEGVVKNDGSIVVLMHGLFERKYLIALKATEDKKEVYITSFRESSDKDIKREFERGEKF